jgi:acetyl esterase/lipase
MIGGLNRALFMMDAISPMNLLYQCRSVYLPTTTSLPSTSSLSSEALSASSSTLSLSHSATSGTASAATTTTTGSATATGSHGSSVNVNGMTISPIGTADNDPMVSPILASDALLSKFPPTSIMVGGFDPFLDDSVDLAHRLHANQVPCRYTIDLSQSFLRSLV